MKKRVLFLVKKKLLHYSRDKYSHGSSGLFNSCRYVAEALKDLGFDTKLVEVDDGNDVDRETFRFKPDFVIIEAYWVTPTKFDQLIKLHPTVRWIVRNHSKVAFMAQEGSTFPWSIEYVRQGVSVACNSRITTEVLQGLMRRHGLDPQLVGYLPNFYRDEVTEEQRHRHQEHHKHKHSRLDVGCFGAIRPLKNQVNQACAALEFADRKHKNLFFHINGTRVESGGEPVLRALDALFSDSKVTLVKHPWYSHDEFLEEVGKMDVLMQASYSETFNIVSADAVTAGVPIIGSSEIEWLKTGWVEPNDLIAMCIALERSIDPEKKKEIVHRQRAGLAVHNDWAKIEWLQVLNK